MNHSYDHLQPVLYLPDLSVAGPTLSRKTLGEWKAVAKNTDLHLLMITSDLGRSPEVGRVVLHGRWTRGRGDVGRGVKSC
jgi:hypothetical protein